MSTEPLKKLLGTEDFLSLFLWSKHRRFAWCHPSRWKSMKFHLMSWSTWT